MAQINLLLQHLFLGLQKPLALLFLVPGIVCLIIAITGKAVEEIGIGAFKIKLGRIVGSKRIGVAGVAALCLLLSGGFAFASQPSASASGNPTPTTVSARKATPTATLTPTATPPSQGWYYAHVPGPGCDLNGGQWARSLDQFYYTCLTDSLRMTMKDSGFANILTRFSPPVGKTFPDNATATLDVFGFDSYACVNFGFEQFSQPDYGMTVCQDGGWRIFKTQTGTAVASGTSSSQDGHFLLLETKTGNLRIFFINGVQIGSFQDAPNIPAVDIIIELDASTSASAQFKDFRITSQS